MAVQTEKTEFSDGITGTIDGQVDVWRDGSNLKFKDAIAGTKSLTELSVGGVTDVSGLTGLNTDFATQYHNLARLVAYLADAANAAGIGIPADVAGNANLAAHIADVRIHHRRSPRVYEVGADLPYPTLQAALNAIALAAEPTLPKIVRIHEGTYSGSVTVNVANTHIVGVDRDACIVTSAQVDGGAPWGTIDVQANGCSVQNLTVKNTGSGGDNHWNCLMVGGSGSTPVITSFRANNCSFISVYGGDAVWYNASTSGCVLENCYISGIADIVCMNGDGNVVRNCTIKGNNTWGAFWTSKKLSGASTTTFIYNCIAEDCAHFVLLATSSVYVQNCAAASEMPLYAVDATNSTSSLYYGANSNLRGISGSSTGVVNIIPLHATGGVSNTLESESHVGLLQSYDLSLSDWDNLPIWKFGSGNTYSADWDLINNGVRFNFQIEATRYDGGGQGLTALNATQLTSGTVLDARLSSNVPKKDAANTFTAANTFSAAINANGEVVLPNGTAATNRVRLGSGYIYADAGTMYFKGLSYFELGAGFYIHSSTHAAAVTSNRNFLISLDGQTTNILTAFYNATAANRSVAVDGRLSVGGNTAVTSGAQLQVTGDISVSGGGLAKRVAGITTDVAVPDNNTTTDMVTYTIPANTLTAGKTYRLTAHFKTFNSVSNNGGQDLTGEVSLGGTSLIAVTQTNISADEIEYYSRFEVLFRCASTGVAGTFRASGDTMRRDSVALAYVSEPAFNEGTVDTTVANTLKIRALNAPSDSAYSASVCVEACIEQLN